MSEAFDPYRKWLGIPPHEQPPNHYRLLGVGEFEDDPDVIDNAANRQMAHVRTFQSGRHGAISQRLLNELSAARICLLNADRKQEYDASLRQQQAAASPHVPASPPQAGSREGFAPPVKPPRPPVRLPGQPSAPAPVPVSVGGGPGTPGPIVKAPASTVARRVASRRRYRSVQRRRRSPLPIVLGLIAATIAIGALVVVLNMDKGSAEPDRRPPRPEASRSRPSLPANRSGRGSASPDSRPGESPMATDDFNREQASDFDFSKPFDPAPPGQPRPVAIPREEQFTRAIDAAYEALASREWTKAGEQLAVADELHQSDAENDRVNRLNALKTYLTGFWQEVHRSIREDLEPGDKFTHGGLEYELVAEEGETVTFKVNGAELERKIASLDAQHALAFATHGFAAEDAFARVYAAAHLTLDREAADIPDRRATSLRLLRDAAKLSGQSNPYLAKELGVDPEMLEQLPEATESESEASEASESENAGESASARRLTDPALSIR